MTSYISDLFISISKDEETEYDKKGYIKIPKDLNEGTEGSAKVYLWYKVSHDRTQAITRVQITWNKLMQKALVDAGYTKINKDLNEDTPGGESIYLFYYKGNKCYDFPITAVDITLNFTDDFKRVCSQGYQCSACDLNRGAGGNQIFFWAKHEGEPEIFDIKITQSYRNDESLLSEGFLRLEENLNFFSSKGASETFLWYRYNKDPCNGEGPLRYVKITTKSKEEEEEKEKSPSILIGEVQPDTLLWAGRSGDFPPITYLAVCTDINQKEAFEKAGYSMFTLGNVGRQTNNVFIGFRGNFSGQFLPTDSDFTADVKTFLLYPQRPLRIAAPRYLKDQNINCDGVGTDYKGLSIQIRGGVDQDASSVTVSGCVSHILTEMEQVAWFSSFEEEILKKTVSCYFNQTPKSIWFQDSKDNGNFFSRNNLAPTMTNLYPKSATIASVTSELVTLATKKFHNGTKQFCLEDTASTMLEEVATTIKTAYSQPSYLMEGAKVFVNAEFLNLAGAGANNSSPLCCFSFIQSLGQDDCKVQHFSTGPTTAISLGLDPGESIEARLSAQKCSMQIRVIFESFLSGYILSKFKDPVDGYYAWAAWIPAVMSLASNNDMKRNAKCLTLDMNITYYCNATVTLFREEGKPVVKIMNTNRTPPTSSIVKTMKPESSYIDVSSASSDPKLQELFNYGRLELLTQLKKDGRLPEHTKLPHEQIISIKKKVVESPEVPTMTGVDPIISYKFHIKLLNDEGSSVVAKFVVIDQHTTLKMTSIKDVHIQLPRLKESFFGDLMSSAVPILETVGKTAVVVGGKMVQRGIETAAGSIFM